MSEPKCYHCRGADDLKPVHPRTHWGASQRQRGGNGFSEYTVLMCVHCRKKRRGRWQHLRPTGPGN